MTAEAATSEQRAPPVIIVAGPTGCGKSALGIFIARAFQGEVVCLDSVQVYKGLDIGSAKVLASEQQGIPHHLIDLVTPDTHFDAALFRERALRCITELQERNVQPVIVGGTTLYLTALLHGLADLPPHDQTLRVQLAAQDKAERFALLQQHDPVSARQLHPNDTTRVIRALEVVLTTGTPVSTLHEQHGFPEPCLNAIILVLDMPRADLYARIKLRTAELVQNGIVEETQRVIEAYGDSIPGMRTIGYAEVVRFLRGTLGADHIESEIAQSTRRLAKRQTTFWRNEPRKRGWRVRGATPPLPGKQPGFPLPVHHFDREEIIEQLRSSSAKHQKGVEIWYIDGLAVLR